MEPECLDLIWPLDSPFVLSPPSCSWYSACQRLNTVLFCCVNCILSRVSLWRQMCQGPWIWRKVFIKVAPWHSHYWLTAASINCTLFPRWHHTQMLIMNSKHLCSIVDGNNDVYVVIFVWHHTQMLIMNTTGKHLRLTQYCWWHQQCLCCDYLSYAVNIATATWWCVKFDYDTAMI